MIQRRKNTKIPLFPTQKNVKKHICNRKNREGTLTTGDDGDKGIGEQEGENHQIDIGGAIAGGGAQGGGGGAWRSLQPTAACPKEQPMAQIARKAAYEAAKEDVARIVDAQVDAGISAERSPNEQQQGETAMADEQGKEEAEAKGVGGMAGDEAVAPATVAVDNVDQMHDGWLMRGTEALEQGLADAGGHLVAQEDGEPDGQHRGPKALGGIVVGYDIEQHNKHGD